LACHVLGARSMRATRQHLPSLRRLLALAVVLGGAAACSSAETEPTSPGAPANEPENAPPEQKGESKESKEKPKDPETAIVLGLASEDFSREGASIALVHIVAKVDGAVAAEETVQAGSGQPIFPRELKLAAPKNVPDAKVEIQVDGDFAAQPNSHVVQRSATTRFVPGKKKLAYVLLEARCNTAPVAGGFGVSGPHCEGGLTCIGGKCQSPDLGELPDYHADWQTNPPSRCGTAPGATVNVGEGQSAYADLPDGATVALEQGPQCGHHLWVGARMTNLQQSGTTTVLSAKQPSTGKIMPSTAYPYAYSAIDGGACELPGLRYQLDIAGVKASDLLGKPLDITVEASDKLGRKATVTRHVNVASTIKNAQPHCQNH
jgi:hypothetical protein